MKTFTVAATASRAANLSGDRSRGARPGQVHAPHPNAAFGSEIAEEETTALTEIWHQDSLVATFRTMERRLRTLADRSLVGLAHPGAWAVTIVLCLAALVSLSTRFDSVESSQTPASDSRAGYLFIDLDEVPEVAESEQLVGRSKLSPDGVPGEIGSTQDPKVTTLEELPLEETDSVLDLATIEALDEEEREMKIQERTRRARLVRRSSLRKTRSSSSSRPPASLPTRSAPSGTTKIQLDASDPWAD